MMDSLTERKKQFGKIDKKKKPTSEPNNREEREVAVL